jgi:hypothetical protein
VCPARAKIPRQLEPQSAAGLDEQGLVNCFVRDAHLRIGRIIDPQARRDLLRGPAERRRRSTSWRSRRQRTSFGTFGRWLRRTAAASARQAR